MVTSEVDDVNPRSFIHMMEHLNSSPLCSNFSPRLIRSIILLVCFASCLALRLPMPVVIDHAALGKPATTLRAPSPLGYRLLLVVVLRLFEDAFFLLDLLGMLVLNEDSSRDVIFYRGT